MFRVEMSASRHSSVSCESDSVVRALLGSSQVRELQVSRAAARGWDTDFPFRGLFCLASAVLPRFFPELCFHVGGEFDVLRHSRFLFHVTPAGRATT